MPRYRDYGHWLGELKKEQVGKIWAAKLDFDLANANLAQVIAERFEAAINGSLHKLESLGSPLSVIDAVIKLFTPEFDLQGQRTPVATVPYSCVVSLETFSKHLLNPRVYTTIMDEGDDDMDFVWDNLGVLVTPRHHYGELKSEREFFWCTPSRRLHSIIGRCSSRNKAATTARTRLGLHRILKGQRLIRIDIPPEKLEGKRMRAPTTFDGGSNHFFIPCDHADGYGRTVNLHSVRRDLRELVVEKIPFTEDFGVDRVGRVGARVPPADFDGLESLI